MILWSTNNNPNPNPYPICWFLVSYNPFCFHHIHDVGVQCLYLPCVWLFTAWSQLRLDGWHAAWYNNSKAEGGWIDCLEAKLSCFLRIGNSDKANCLRSFWVASSLTSCCKPYHSIIYSQCHFSFSVLKKLRNISFFVSDTLRGSWILPTSHHGS